MLPPTEMKYLSSPSPVANPKNRVVPQDIVAQGDKYYSNLMSNRAAAY